MAADWPSRLGARRGVLRGPPESGTAGLPCPKFLWAAAGPSRPTQRPPSFVRRRRPRAACGAGTAAHPATIRRPKDGGEMAPYRRDLVSVGLRLVAVDLGGPLGLGAVGFDGLEDRPCRRFFGLAATALAPIVPGRRIRGSALASLAVVFEIDDFSHDRRGLSSPGPHRIVCPTIRLSLAYRKRCHAQWPVVASAGKKHRSRGQLRKPP